MRDLSQVGANRRRRLGRVAASSNDRYWIVVVWVALVAWSIALFAALRADYADFLYARFDLGNMTQAIWSTAHGRFLETTEMVRRSLAVFQLGESKGGRLASEIVSRSIDLHDLLQPRLEHAGGELACRMRIWMRGAEVDQDDRVVAGERVEADADAEVRHGRARPGGRRSRRYACSRSSTRPRGRPRPRRRARSGRRRERRDDGAATRRSGRRRDSR